MTKRCLRFRCIAPNPVNNPIECLKRLNSCTRAIPRKALLKRLSSRQAKQHDVTTYQLLKTIPGLGAILALVIFYEIGSIERFETVQRFASYARLARGDKESAGKKVGKGQAKMGNAYLKWAFSEVAVMFLRGNPDAQKAVERLRSKYGKGKALSILAHKLGRCVYTMLSKQRPFDKEKFMKSFG